ncbi:hypothetical protein SpCBS45565_g07775 [Spizellomyces sp. 'palustris']|nr:hypothetical protein SpCBS45565_g07775 [Spizellomyces sp. 'palustris']
MPVNPIHHLIIPHPNLVGIDLGVWEGVDLQVQVARDLESLGDKPFHLVSTNPELTFPSSKASATLPRPLQLKPIRTNSPTSTSSYKPLDSGMDLVTSMASRLNKLEGELKKTRTELQIKDARIEKLEADLKWEKAQSQRADDDKTEALEMRCAMLQARVTEMEAFLHRQNMIWKSDIADEGDTDGIDIEQRAGQTVNIPKPSYQRAFPYDLPRLMASIKELNQLAGEGVATITSDAHGTGRLKTPTSVPLTLYRNGFMLMSGPFRRYTDPAAQLFMRDLVDGYYPYELKHRFPDGVPFDVRDRHDEWYDTAAAATYVPFSGKGYAVDPDKETGTSEKEQNSSESGLDEEESTSGEEECLSDVAVTVWEPTKSTPSEKKTGSDKQPATVQIHNVHTTGSTSYSQSNNAFLARLPKYIIRNGTILNLRADVESLLQTPQTHRIPITIQVPDQPDSSHVLQRSTTLRVHAPDDETEFVIGAKSGHTVSEVKTAMLPLVTKMLGDDREWDLRTALQGPGVVYGGDMTLEVGHFTLKRIGM